MKYTIEGFSQEKLTQLKLKVADALILRWFFDFAACGKMKRLVKENKENTKTVFYWVNYQAVIDEFPCLEITNVKSIQLRFQKYVELGLLEKTTLAGGKYGLQPYFAIKEKCIELEYSTSNTGNTIKENELNISKEEEKKSILPVENNFQSNTLPVENNFQSNTFPVENNFQSNTFPVENNFQSLYINSSINLNSSTTLSNSSTTDKARESLVKNTIKKYFNSLALFSDDLVPNLLLLTTTLNDKEIESYIAYVITLVKSQKPHNMQGLFYKLVFQKNTFSEFLNQKNISLEKTNKIQKWICPVCQNENEFYMDCKNCNTEFNKRFDGTHIKFKKQIYELPPDTKEILNKDLNRYLRTVSILSFEPERIEENRKALTEIYKKFGVTYAR